MAIDLDNFTPLDYVRLRYPAPTPEHPDYGFYQQWGHEHFLIKSQGYDYEQFQAIHRRDYALLFVAEAVKAICDEEGNVSTDLIQELWQGMPLVRAKRQLFQFPLCFVKAGWLGFVLKTFSDGSRVVWFPSIGQYVGVFDPNSEAVEDAGVLYDLVAQFSYTEV